MQLFVVGYPSGYGGADTELWHVLKLWRAHQIDVTLIPTWSPPLGWREPCDAIGAKSIVLAGPHELTGVTDLRGSPVISFCNGDFLKHAATFRQLGCSLVWAGCMNWLFDAELAHYAEHGPFDAYVFQSHFQWDALFPRLAEFGVRQEQCHLIRGPLDTTEFPFRPRRHDADAPFVVGRLSRVDLHKWHPDTWSIIASIPFDPVQARVMAWEERLRDLVGPPPDWVEAVAACDQSPQDFLASLHCLFQLSGLATENWSRVGLEAMATGVPIVTDRRGGWLEMIEHGRTGFLAASPQDAADYAGQMAKDEPLRNEIIHRARERLTTSICNPVQIIEAWQELFARL
jgi:hypothetical protein